MKKYFLIVAIVINLFSAEFPQALEFEKILKNMQEKKNQYPDLTVNNNQTSIATNVANEFADITLVGTTQIGLNKYCYILINGSNRIIKASIGTSFKNKTIESISEFGITYSEGIKSTFIPIMNEQQKNIVRNIDSSNTNE